VAGRSAAERQELEAVRHAVMTVFEGQGFETIVPDILQPADVFLDRSGENIRSRTFVFTDPSGAELCLRPDLTVPTCRFHLTHQADPRNEARYCYCGPAFRFQPGGADRLHPSEFDQAGAEWFGASDAELAEAEVLAMTIRAVEAAGLRRYAIRLGDLGLFEALLQSLAMPERWRRRLSHQFWRPRQFRALLDQLTGAAIKPRTSISGLIDALSQSPTMDAVELVESALAAEGLALIGGRNAREIAARLTEKALDRTEKPLSEADAQKIETYLALSGSPADSGRALDRLAPGLGSPMLEAVRRFHRRNALLAAGGLALDGPTFAGVFGRQLEYYTGFVFQIEASDPDGQSLAIAGGGRYDRLLSDIGSPYPVPAVGCAIHTERLAAACRAIVR
jgi:ATP phosphoribosyltransferase regulatory subunit